MERSGQRILRVGLDFARPEYYTPLTLMADRIQCLSIPTVTRLDGATFSFLKRLCLAEELDPTTILGLSRARFPALRRLDICFTMRSNPLLVDETVDPPRPQTLRLSTCRQVNVMPIVQRYGQALTSLDYTIPKGMSFSENYIISLPQLKTLAFNDFGKEKSPITMITPMLKVFVMSTNYESTSFPLEMDLGRLTHVRADGKQTPPLLELSGLKVLHIYPDPPCYDEILQPLVDKPSVCRGLGIVELRLKELSDVDYSDFRKLFLRINGPRERHINNYIHSRFTPWHQGLLQYGHYTVSDSLDLSLLVELTFGQCKGRLH